MIKVTVLLFSIFIFVNLIALPAHACSPSHDYVPPTTSERYEKAEDVVLVSIRKSNITKEEYERTYGPNPEIVTVKVEKVYKGNRKVGDTFTYARIHGDGVDCNPSPHFRHLGIKDENTRFYTTYTEPSLLLFLEPEFVDGSESGYVEYEKPYSLSLSDMVIYSDGVLKDISKAAPGFPVTTPSSSTSSTPTLTTDQRIVLIKQIIVLLNQLIDMVR